MQYHPSEFLVASLFVLLGIALIFVFTFGLLRLMVRLFDDYDNPKQYHYYLTAWDKAQYHGAATAKQIRMPPSRFCA